MKNSECRTEVVSAGSDPSAGQHGLQAAYRYAWDSRSGYNGQTFDEAEPELRRVWEAADPPRPLSWEQARPAVREAWHCSQ